MTAERLEAYFSSSDTSIKFESLQDVFEAVLREVNQEMR